MARGAKKKLWKTFFTHIFTILYNYPLKNNPWFRATGYLIYLARSYGNLLYTDEIWNLSGSIFKLVRKHKTHLKGFLVSLFTVWYFSWQWENSESSKFQRAFVCHIFRIMRNKRICGVYLLTNYRLLKKNFFLYWLECQKMKDMDMYWKKQVIRV